MSEWWLSRGDGKTEGPLSTQLVVRGLVAGVIPRHAIVCAVGAQQWIRVSAVDEIWEAVDSTESRTSVTETPWFIGRTESGRHALPDTEPEDERTQLLMPGPRGSEQELRAKKWEAAPRTTAALSPSTQTIASKTTAAVSPNAQSNTGKNDASDLGPMRARVPTLTGITDTPAPVAPRRATESRSAPHANGLASAQDKSVPPRLSRPTQGHPAILPTSGHAGLTPLPLGGPASAANFAGLQSLSSQQRAPARSTKAQDLSAGPAAEPIGRAPKADVGSAVRQPLAPQPPPRPSTPYGASPLGRPSFSPNGAQQVQRPAVPTTSANAATQSPLTQRGAKPVATGPRRPLAEWSAMAAPNLPLGLPDERLPVRTGVAQPHQGRKVTTLQEDDPSPDDEKTLALVAPEVAPSSSTVWDDDEPTRFLPKVQSRAVPPKALAQAQTPNQATAPRRPPVLQRPHIPADSADEKTSLFAVSPAAKSSAPAEGPEPTTPQALESALGSNGGSGLSPHASSLVSDPLDLLEDIDDESSSAGRVQAVPMIVLPQDAMPRAEPVAAPSIVASPPSKPPQARRARLSVPTIVLKPEPIVHQEATQPAVRALRRRSPVRLSFGSLVAVLLVLAVIALSAYFALLRH